MANEGEGSAREVAAADPSVRSELSDALEGAVYPLSRRELVLVAQEGEAGRHLLARLSTLPDAVFHDEREIAERMAAALPT